VTFTLTVPKELESAVVRLLVDGAEEPRARQTADGFILNPGHKVKLT
jgi:uroporphyrinogen-III decarboxylase